jgi:hypothetical protein
MLLTVDIRALTGEIDLSLLKGLLNLNGKHCERESGNPTVWF